MAHFKTVIKLGLLVLVPFVYCHSGNSRGRGGQIYHQDGSEVLECVCEYNI